MDGKLTYLMRWVAGITAILIAYGSAKLSVAGIGLGGDLSWLNWIIAISLFVAEFMSSGKHDELNWMILVIGIGAYAYSITTNIVGIEKYMMASGNSVGDTMDKITMYAGGFFMDVYPELVLRWALGESKVGDLLGNIVKTYKNPQILTKSFTTVAPATRVVPTSIPRSENNPQHSQTQRPNFNPALRPIPKTSTNHPTLHQVRLADMDDMDEDE